ncbi:MAG: hypothetical protein BWY32_03869 [bacterium ADurb.Bin243]|nr:MAG: hypothetical protein BWY32_03869 [bacterium ADurb.Bin243]
MSSGDISSQYVEFLMIIFFEAALLALSALLSRAYILTAASCDNLTETFTPGSILNLNAAASSGLSLMVKGRDI